MVTSTLTRNDVEFLSYVLSIGADPGRTLESQRYHHRFLPIEFAAFSSTVSNAKLLLKHGAIIDGTDAIQLVARHGRLEMVRCFIEAGGNVDGILDPTIMSSPPYRVYGIALHYAASAGYIDVVKLLLDSGADPKARDTEGDTAMRRARANNHKRVIKLLQLYDDD